MSSSRVTLPGRMLHVATQAGSSELQLSTIAHDSNDVPSVLHDLGVDDFATLEASRISWSAAAECTLQTSSLTRPGPASALRRLG